ncbi:hypothetical protein F5887DRAFT_23796 [Amanita rubescens]|nr:hypothetical protein F5887DRAFT_23796 [Amanita rubescens]
MNRFRKRSDAQSTRLPFSVQPGQHPDALPEIPQASDFRTSLILTDLAKRFSVLRSPTGEPVSFQDLKSKFAEQRARGAQNQISEDEEAMLLETLGRMRSKASALSSKSQDSVDESAEQHSVKSTSTINSVIQASITSSPSGRSTKRYSNNLFGSGRLRDYSYFRNAGSGHGRTRSARLPSIAPTETSVSIQEVASIPDSIQPVTSDNSSIQSSMDAMIPNLLGPSAIPEEHMVQSPSTTDPSLIKRASMALADAINELEETEDEVVMPRLSRPSLELNPRQAEGAVVDSAKSPVPSLHQPAVVEAGTAISSDNQVTTSYHERGASPVYSRTLPGYVPGMPRPMTPRDIEFDEQRSLSATPRAMSPLSSDMTDNTSSASTTLAGPESALRQSSRPTSPTSTAPRPSTPSRATPLFLQRSPSGRRTPDNGVLGGDPVNFDSPLNSSVMSRRRPVSPSVGNTYQSTTSSSRPSTPSNVIWNIGSTDLNQKLHNHDRNGSWASDAGSNDGQSAIVHHLSKQLTSTILPESPFFDLVFGTDGVPNSRMARSPTPTNGVSRSPALPNMDTPSRNGSKRSSRQISSSPFHFDQFAPLTLLPVINSSRSSLESTGSSYHSWDIDKDQGLNMFSDTDTQQPAWHDLPPDRINSFVSGADEDEWDPEEIIGRYAGLKKSDFKAMQEKLVSLSVARDDSRERAPSIRRRRPSTSQSNYSTNGRDRIASPPPVSSAPVGLEPQVKATAVLNAMADNIQFKQPEMIDTAIQRVPDTEPSPNTRRQRDLAHALFGDDIEKERERTPKPVPLRIVESMSTDESTKGPATNELKENSTPPSQSESKAPENAQDADLVREVQQKADAATLALRKTPPNPEQRLERSAQGSISRRRISPSQISEPRLVSASTSVDTIPVRSPPHSSPGTSKIGSRFRKLRGTLRAKNAPPAGDESQTRAEIDSPRPSQDFAYDASKLKLTPLTTVTENGRIKASVASPPASAGPGLKGFMARFRSRKGTDNASLDRRDGSHMSPSVVSLAASRSTVTQVGSAVPSSSSSLHQTPDPTPPAIPPHQEAANTDPNEAALRQLFDAASDLGLDPSALNALLARTPSLSKTTTMQDKTARVTMAQVPENADEATVQDQSITPEDEAAAPQPLSESDFPPAHFERADVNGVSTRKPEDSRRPQDSLINNANVIVRRTIIYPSEFRNTPSPVDVNSLMKKKRRRGSVTSASGRSIQDRAPTPPPPKSPTSKSFSNTPSPPVPQIPRSLLSSPEPKISHSPTHHSFEKSNYDSLYEMYSEDNQIAISAGNEPSSKGQSNANTDAPAIELIELSNGETIWSIVNGLRDEDEESVYASRTSFTSEFSARDGNSDGMQVYVKEHRRNASNGSGTSFTSRRRLLHGKARPETKVYYSSPAQIGRLIENLSQGMDSGSFNFTGNARRPGHSASSSLSMAPSTNDTHWTVEDRLDHYVELA